MKSACIHIEIRPGALLSAYIYDIYPNIWGYTICWTCDDKDLSGKTICKHSPYHSRREAAKHAVQTARMLLTIVQIARSKKKPRWLPASKKVRLSKINETTTTLS